MRLASLLLAATVLVAAKPVPSTSSIAIASIDNIEMAEFTNPPLTTINVQKAAMGRMAVQTIINHEANRAESPVTVLLPSSLVIRKSSGAK